MSCSSFRFCSFFTQYTVCTWFLWECIIHLKTASCVVFFSESKCECFSFHSFGSRRLKLNSCYVQFFVWPSKGISTWNDSILMTLVWFHEILFLTIEQIQKKMFRSFGSLSIWRTFTLYVVYACKCVMNSVLLCCVNVVERNHSANIKYTNKIL